MKSGDQLMWFSLLVLRLCVTTHYAVTSYGQIEHVFKWLVCILQVKDIPKMKSPSTELARHGRWCCGWMCDILMNLRFNCFGSRVVLHPFVFVHLCIANTTKPWPFLAHENVTIMSAHINSMTNSFYIKNVCWCVPTNVVFFLSRK